MAVVLLFFREDWFQTRDGLRQGKQKHRDSTTVLHEELGVFQNSVFTLSGDMIWRKTSGVITLFLKSEFGISIDNSANCLDV